MANPDHLTILQDAITKDDIGIWNDWIQEQILLNEFFRPDLSNSNLETANLAGADLRNTDLQASVLRDADLRGSNLISSNLTGSDLTNVDLTNAYLTAANLTETNLTNSVLTDASFFRAILSRADLAKSRLLRTNLQEANLTSVNLAYSDLTGANFNSTLLDGSTFEGVTLAYTIFANVDLSTVIGLESVRHARPVVLDFSVLLKSKGLIPDTFLTGIGMPSSVIEFVRSLRAKPIQYYSAFISYSSSDERFARKLHDDLQMNGVRVWFAPEDLKIGDLIEDSIDQAIRVYDKLIVVLSQNSVDRAWVRREFSKAVYREKQDRRIVLFPIRLDNSVFETSDQWAYELRNRNIGDFSNWTKPVNYQNAFNRLLRDLNSGS